MSGPGSATAAPWLSILGINEDGALSPGAAALVAKAGLVVGGARHLALAAPLIQGARLAWPTPITDALPPILAGRDGAVVVLASGDPLWFGVGTLLLQHVPIGEIAVVPAPSAFALAAARLGWAVQDVACLSCCGRPTEALIPHFQPGARLLVLSAFGSTPGAIARLLEERGFGASTMHVLESIGGGAERVRRVRPVDVPGDIGPLNIVGVEVAGPVSAALPLAGGLDEIWFEHDGQITRHEIRAITLAALAPRQGEVLWDIGAGAGSIGIEWMLAHPANRAVGVEIRPDRAARARRNGAALGVPALRIVDGAAPGVFGALPPPDAVFLGGGAHVPGVIDGAWGALRPGGRLVANAVTLATEAALVAAQGRLGGSLLRIGLERLDHVGGMAAYRPAMTVTQWVAHR